MRDKKHMKEKLPNGELSLELRAILEDESREAEIQAAIDAALEEGFIITRKEVAKALLEKQKP